MSPRQPVPSGRTTTQEIQLTAQKASLREAEARLKLAETRLKRARELFQQGIIAQQEADDAQSEFNAWQGRAERLKAEIASIKLDVERSTIRAPFAGVIVAERCAVGEWIGQGDPVAELISLYDLEIQVYVPERYFSTIQPGYETAVQFESLPGYELSAKVSAVVPRANPQARTFPVKVRINNKEGKVGAGMLAQVSFSAGESYRATVVPKDAVITRGERRFVYVVAEDSTVSQVPVETGVGAGASPVWVLSGISWRNSAAPIARIVVTTPSWNVAVTPIVKARWMPSTIIGIIGSTAARNASGTVARI